MTRLTYGSLFSGVGGFDIGFDRAGYECQWQVEWDAHCQQTLAYHWPNTPLYGDVQTVKGSEITPVDVITYGSPCQDLTIAGKRGGIDGERSSMFFEAARIFKEMRDATDGVFPRITVWENVPGALTSNKGEDFKAVLQTLDEVGSLGQWWAVLDARYFGVPQRRRRVFLVSVYDSAIIDRIGHGEVFTFAEGVRGDTSEGVSSGQGDTGASQASVDEIFSFDTQFGSNANVFLNQAPTLKASQQAPSVLVDGILRKLSPIECERLQGWPDNHTLYRIDGKTNSDTTRVKMCGNGVASPVAEWVARQIKPLLESR